MEYVRPPLGLLYPFLRFPVQQEQRPVRAGPVDVNKYDQRAGTPLLCKKAEKIWAVQPEEWKASRRPYCDLSLYKI